MKFLLTFLLVAVASVSARLFENTVRGVETNLLDWQEIPTPNKTVIAERWTTGSNLLVYKPNHEEVTSVQLLSDVWVGVETTAFEFVSHNIWNWRGKVKQAEFHGKLVLTIIRDDITGDVSAMGKVQVDGRIFVFSAARDSLIRIVEIDPMSLPPTKAIPVEKPYADIIQNAQKNDERFPITVLFLFPYAQSSSCSSQTVINRINQLTASYQNQMRSVWTEEYNIPMEAVGRCLVYNYQNDFYAALAYIRGNANVASIRNQTRGDLVALMVDGGGLCGLAYLPGLPITNGDQVSAFSVSATFCVSTYVLEHECGHNMGLNHDRYVNSGGGRAPGNYGGFNPTSSNSPNFRSIMSYADYCRSVGSNCPIWGEYSDNGRLWGNPPGNWPGPTDNRRYFLESAPVVANYR